MSAALSLAKRGGPGRSFHSTHRLCSRAARVVLLAAHLIAARLHGRRGVLTKRCMNIAVLVQSGPWEYTDHTLLSRVKLCAEICPSPAGQSLRLWRASGVCCTAQFSIEVNRRPSITSILPLKLAYLAVSCRRRWQL